MSRINDFLETIKTDIGDFQIACSSENYDQVEIYSENSLTTHQKNFAQVLVSSSFNLSFKAKDSGGYRMPSNMFKLKSQLEAETARRVEAEHALKYYADKNNWLRDKNGWRHDMIITDLDDETLTDWGGRFSGKRAREYFKKYGERL